ncbi:hypothetical protein N7568_06250 [Paenarthrobacter aurescens]|nr:hypothetical protein [Paenarthrobacter aurescens]
MRAALWSPGNRFDDGGHRAAVVGLELRPSRERQAQHLRGTDMAKEVTLVEVKMWPGNFQQRLHSPWQADSPAGHQ